MVGHGVGERLHMARYCRVWARKFGAVLKFQTLAVEISAIRHKSGNYHEQRWLADELITGEMCAIYENSIYEGSKEGGY
jgi:hypothetical protein